ncbi:sugar transport PTS system IIA protein, partial [Kingella kingae PYKK081]
MIGLLIITHETLGAAYKQLAQHFFANQNLEHIHILNVETTDDHEDIISRALSDFTRHQSRQWRVDFNRHFWRNTVQCRHENGIAAVGN